MKIEKIGGIASIVEVFLTVFFMVSIFILFPRLGLDSPSAFYDPVKNMAAWEASPITFYLRGLGFLLLGVTFVILVLALRNRLLNSAPILMEISVIGASVMAALYLPTGIIEFISKEQIALTKDISAFSAMVFTATSLSVAGEFAFGCVVLLIGSAGIKTSKLSRMLSWLLIIEGICFILSFAVNALGILGCFLLIITNLWLGIILISDRHNKDTAIKL